MVTIAMKIEDFKAMIEREDLSSIIKIFGSSEALEEAVPDARTRNALVNLVRQKVDGVAASDSEPMEFDEFDICSYSPLQELKRVLEAYLAEKGRLAAAEASAACSAAASLPADAAAIDASSVVRAQAKPSSLRTKAATAGHNDTQQCLIKLQQAILSGSVKAVEALFNEYRGSIDLSSIDLTSTLSQLHKKAARGAAVEQQEAAYTKFVTLVSEHDHAASRPGKIPRADHHSEPGGGPQGDAQSSTNVYQQFSWEYMPEYMAARIQEGNIGFVVNVMFSSNAGYSMQFDDRAGSSRQGYVLAVEKMLQSVPLSREA